MNKTGARPRTRGRPRGNPPTRSRIAEAARDLFLEHGYQGTTLRAVAAAADVDSALIAYHFGSKKGLFGEAMNIRCGHSLALVDALKGDPAGLADRILAAVTSLWEDDGPDGGPMSVFDGTSMRDEEAMRVFREFLEREVLGRIAEHLGGPEATDRATAAVTVIGGLIFTRYLSPLGPAATLSAADVRAVLAPCLRAALNGRHRPSPRPLARG
ncbi:TetR family transcriptional regulator [Streptomyces sp. NPDC008313]|uniref:TetR/AcrR family transcriptional regulator n=1 Tax=Streptomyces sp. NPDC008313 TaxID=3364826 RepID=UPI0036EFAED9